VSSPLEHVYPDPSPGPDRQVESQLELLRVQAVFQTLPEIDRATFVLRVQHELPGDIPIPLTKEDKMEAYREAKRLMFLRTIILAGIISFSVIAALVLALIRAAYFMPS